MNRAHASWPRRPWIIQFPRGVKALCRNLCFAGLILTSTVNVAEGPANDGVRAQVPGHVVQWCDTSNCICFSSGSGTITYLAPGYSAALSYDGDGWLKFFELMLCVGEKPQEDCFWYLVDLNNMQFSLRLVTKAESAISSALEPLPDSIKSLMSKSRYAIDEDIRNMSDAICSARL